MSQIKDKYTKKDDVFNILSNQRRRYILEVLCEDSNISIKDLAEKVVSLEKDKPLDKVTKMERKSVYVSLYQNHLKKMDRLDAIDYNKKTNKIENINKQFLDTYKKIKQQI